MDRIEIDVYSNPTDSRQYLLFTSCNTKHTRINIPFDMVKKLYRRFYSKHTEEKLKKLKDILIDRRYVLLLIDNRKEILGALRTSDLKTAKSKTGMDV